MFTFDLTAFPPACRALLVPERLSPLGPGEPNQQAHAALCALSPAMLAGGRAMRPSHRLDCCVAALWLLHDFLDESHRISQEISTSDGSYWHGIMHRREPDFGNAKYWFRRVGDHPVFPPLTEAAHELASQHFASAGSDVRSLSHAAGFLAEQTQWDPFRFIDLYEAAYRRRAPAEELCRRVAQAEWQLLFEYCYRTSLDS